MKHRKMICLMTMIFLPLTALGLLYYCLETYSQTVHNDSGFIIGLHAVGFLIINFILWLKNRKQGRIFSVIAALSLLLLIFVLFVAEKIPFCVECDRVKAEDLGFLTHWITPMDM